MITTTDDIPSRIFREKGLSKRYDEEPLAQKASQIYNKILTSDFSLAVKRPSQPLLEKMYSCTIVKNAQFIFLWHLQVKVVPSYPMGVALKWHFDV